MADADLVDFETRIEVFLRDTTNLVFTAAQIDEALSLALAEYNLTLKGTLVIEGLDGVATATTLPAGHRAMLRMGAVGYAVTSRAEERSEAYNLEQAVLSTMRTFGENRLANFQRWLEQVRVRGLLAGAHPWDADHPWEPDDDDTE
jgi:hypothetical protein